MKLIDLLLTRRSVKAQALHAPGPNSDELQQMLTVATRVPDHGKLAPWRIHVLHKEGQFKLAAFLAKRFSEVNLDANAKQIEFERERVCRAPLLLVVMYCPQHGRIPAWEQQLSTGAVCMNILHAAHALGYGANWLTEWPAFDDEVKAFFGGGADDAIAGFIYLGSYDEQLEDRVRPDLSDVVTQWG